MIKTGLLNVNAAIFRMALSETGTDENLSMKNCMMQERKE
jgi:hypothetical protein